MPLPENGYVVDILGLREVGLWGISSDYVDQCFPEIREAVAAGEIAAARHQSKFEVEGRTR